MGNRSSRGGAAARYAAAQTEDIELTDDQLEEQRLAANGADDTDDSDDDNEPIVEVEEEQDPAPDYSHQTSDDDEEEDEEPDADPNDPLASMANQLAEMTRERDEARQAAQRGVDAELHAQEAMMITAAAGAKSALAKAKEDFEKHSAAGNWKAASDAQEAIADAKGDLREIEAGIAEIKERKKAPAKQPQRAAPADPFEAAIANMSDASKTWCRAHKDDLTKSLVRSESAKVGHLAALEAGHKVDTPAYFKFLDQYMGYDVAPKSTRKQPAPKPVGKPRMAAPGGNRSAPADVREVRLSKSELEMAQTWGWTAKKYAQHKAELIKNGKDPSRSGPRYSNESSANRR